MVTGSAFLKRSCAIVVGDTTTKHKMTHLINAPNVRNSICDALETPLLDGSLSHKKKLSLSFIYLL